MPNAAPTARARSEPRQVNPQLIYLLKDFKTNPQLYPKDKKDELLKPYRESGELEYLMNNKEVLEAMWKNTRLTPAPASAPEGYDPGRQSSEGRMGSQGRAMGPYQQHTFVPKADKFRTVPCKYYHRYYNCEAVPRAAARSITAPSSTTTATRGCQCRQE